MKKLHLLPALLFLALISCKEEKDEPNPAISEMEAPCIVLTEDRSSLSRLNDRTATLKYDDKGRIASVTYTTRNEPEFVDRYERNPAGKISKVQTFYGTKVIWEMDFQYDPQGKWMRATTLHNGGVTVLIEYEYDPKGNITKTTKTVENRGDTKTSVKNYEYTNGNLTRMVLERTDGGVDHYVYEHYLDKPAFSLEYDNIFTPTEDLGTPSKNLVKRITKTWPNEEDVSQVIDFTYKLNEAGMPTRTTKTTVVYDHGAVYDYSPDSVVTIRSYKCD